LLAVKLILLRFNKLKLAHLMAKKPLVQARTLANQKEKQRLKGSNGGNSSDNKKKGKRTNDRWKATMTPQR
jgi:hypothetical protein